MSTDAFIFWYLENTFAECILHVDDLLFIKYHDVVFDIFISYLAHRLGYLTLILPPTHVLLLYLRNFDIKMFQILGDIMGSKHSSVLSAR